VQSAVRAPAPSAPSPEKPHRATSTQRHAPHLSRAAWNTSRRGGAVSHYPNSWSRCAKGFQGAMSPQASRHQPYPTSSQARKPCATARAPPEPYTHTNRSPEQGILPPHAAHSRAEPEEPRRSAGAPQMRAAPSKSRPQPVGSARRGAKCKSPTVTWMHDGHNLSCDTVAHVTLHAQ
jgi:hypothetical protein